MFPFFEESNDAHSPEVGLFRTCHSNCSRGCVIITPHMRTASKDAVYYNMQHGFKWKSLLTRWNKKLHATPCGSLRCVPLNWYNSSKAIHCQIGYQRKSKLQTNKKKGMQNGNTKETDNPETRARKVCYNEALWQRKDYTGELKAKRQSKK